MSIYKKIKGVDTKIAGNPIIRHNDLEGRDEYACHPIQAIRGLPEKITNLQNITKEHSSKLVTLKENIDTVEDNAQQISLREDTENTGQLIFTNYDGEETSVQGGFLPDDETIVLNDNNQYKAIGVSTEDSIITGQEIEQTFANIKSTLNAKGGYLDSYNFQTANPTQEELTAYALQDIGIENPEDIWNGTRVINLFTDNSHKVPDTYSWDVNSQTWTNLGNISLISDANNEGLHGLVTGSDDTYKISISADGTMTANGLQEVTERVDNLIVNTYSDNDDITYSADYTNKHFAPLSFVSKLYLTLNTDTDLKLIDTPPEVSSTGYLTVTSTTEDYDWNNPTFTVTRTLEANTSLTNENSITFTINFETTQDCSLAFGARMRVGQEYIGSEQIYGSEDYTAGNIYTQHFTVYSDLLTTTTSYHIGTDLVVEVFLKSEDTSTIQTYIACGYQTNNGNIYSYAQFNYSNVTIDTSLIADNAVTYEKLSTSLQDSIDQIDTNAQDIEELKKKQDNIYEYTNIEVTEWVEETDTQYTSQGYIYRADVNLDEVNALMIPNVTFSLNDVISGNYSPVARTFTHGVSIWSKVNNNITIPSAIFVPADEREIITPNSAGGETLNSVNSNTFRIPTKIGETLVLGNSVPDNTYNITWNLTNCSIVGEAPTTIRGMFAVKVTLEADEGYILPTNIEVTGAYKIYSVKPGQTLTSGTLTLIRPVEDVEVTIIAIDNRQQYTITSNITNGIINYTSVSPGNGKIYEGTNLVAEIIPDEGYTYPSSIQITGFSEYTYNSDLGIVEGNAALSDVTITAECESTAPAIVPYLTFRSPASFSISADRGWDGTLEYSTDTTTWNTWDGTQVSSGSNNELYLRGTENTVITGNSQYYWHFGTSASLECIGNIETLLDYQTVLNGQHPSMADSCCRSMFRNCTDLTTAPELPATTLTDSCYRLMFEGCSGLISAPALPATALASHCYRSMFHGCTNLTSAPALPAMTLADSCYRGMFGGCSGLTTAPELPATTLASSCYREMFSDCTGLTIIPALPATTLADGCYRGMFYGCASLATVPTLPATTLASSCYMGMFQQCLNLKLSTTQVGLYQNEYRIPYGVESGINASDALFAMFTDTSGTFTDDPDINITYYTSNAIILPDGTIIPGTE